MNIRKMRDEQLLRLSQEIEVELNRRSQTSVKKRIKGRKKSYRRSNGSSALPAMAIGK